MTNSELELWNKIKAFQFDKPNIRLTFAKRLARENAIPEHFANQIIDEYRKFIFLCSVSKDQIAPSHYVDLAWHLHLTYTKSYWIDLCKNTINRDLHHNPTEGGTEEDKKFKNLYRNTLSLYEFYFSSKAPDAVWPNENDGVKNTIVEIDKSRNWVIPKPDFSFRGQKNSFSIIAIIFSALLLGCSSYAGAVPFVLLFVLVVGIVFFLVRRHNRQAIGNNSSGCGSSGCGGIFGSSDSGDSGDGGDSGCSSGCSGGCGGGGD
jgi:hypothetical protein